MSGFLSGLGNLGNSISGAVNAAGKDLSGASQSAQSAVDSGTEWVDSQADKGIQGFENSSIGNNAAGHALGSGVEDLVHFQSGTLAGLASTATGTGELIGAGLEWGSGHGFNLPSGEIGRAGDEFHSDPFYAAGDVGGMIGGAILTGGAGFAGDAGDAAEGADAALRLAPDAAAGLEDAARLAPEAADELGGAADSISVGSEAAKVNLEGDFSYLDSVSWREGEGIYKDLSNLPPDEATAFKNGLGDGTIKNVFDEKYLNPNYAPGVAREFNDLPSYMQQSIKNLNGSVPGVIREISGQADSGVTTWLEARDAFGVPFTLFQ